jgi:ribonuclease HII
MAMQKAIAALDVKVDIVLVDGKFTIPSLAMPQKAIVKGDSLCFNIAAASIFAKLARDHFMRQEAKLYPNYGFASNVGYGTKEHIDAIKKSGITPLHRRNFEPIKSMLM